MLNCLNMKKCMKECFEMYLLYYRNIQYVEQDGELYYLVKNAQRKIKPPQNKRFIEFYYCPIMCIS